MDILVEQGYAALGEQRICMRAGVSRGALRHHYPQGRYDLLPNVVESLLDDEATRMASLGPLSAKERLYLMLYGLMAMPHRQVSVAILEIWMAARGDAKLARCTKSIFDDVLTRLFGHAPGQPADAEELALRCLLHGATLHRFSSDYNSETLQQSVRWMLDRLDPPPKVDELLAAWLESAVKAEPALA
ncbi:TetR/AcrR family transcriptional regulator [Chitiniphilus eburneus]|uniref:TetR/AcrR family transcriptional regulator n=1 Tax=Chitiniphilus eburneus TaxID=2571148 RepID=A0A4U0Q1F6_9NEIS|nr:TetR/AcrR family transcriptional regulator [Chitiniphilus eburneus]